MTTLRRAADWPLVGRRREMERIATTVRTGRGGVVLGGDAGVGKSRIAREALAEAEDAGRATAAVIATRAAAELPLGALATLLPAAQVRRTGREDVTGWAVEELAGLASHGPLVLLVDDAHLLDATSAAVLLELARSGRAVVLATVRSGEPAPDAMVALWREGIADRIEVEHLQRHETETLVATVLGGAVDGSTRRDLWDASRGNALVLRELVLGALENDLLRNDDGLWRLTERLAVPPPLAELIRARLAEASPPERSVLELLALGEPLGLSTLVALTSPEAVDAAERRGLLAVTPVGQRREVWLTHPLHGEVVRAGMTAIRTMSVSRLLAEAVERDGARRREDVMRLALWRLEGGGHVHPELMLEAARRAYFTNDDMLAERLARAALAAGGGVDAALMLSEVLGALSRHSEVVSLLDGIEDEAETDAQRALVAIRHADSLFWGLDRVLDADAVLAAAGERVADRVWREELAGLRAAYDFLGGRPREALDAVASNLAEREGRPFVQAAVLAIPALAVCGRTGEAVAVAERAVAERQALGDQPMLAGPMIHQVGEVVALGEAGRIDEALALADAVYEGALDARDRSDQGWAALVLGRTLELGGRLVSAVDRCREGVVAFTDLGQTGQLQWCLGSLTLAAAQAGDTAQAHEARAMLDALPATPVQMMEPEVERARAWAAIVGDHAADARRRFEAAAELAHDRGAFALELRALHDLARIGVPAAAAERLRDLAGRVDGDLAPVRISYIRALVDNDGDELDRCADAFESLGAWLYAAEAAAAAAASHLRAHNARRSRRSSRRSVALARRCESARTPALALAGEAGRLTRRERQIAEAAATGVPAAEIADRLVVGVRTVESHLQRIYSKLGVHSRAELADVLAAELDGANLDAADLDAGGRG